MNHYFNCKYLFLTVLQSYTIKKKKETVCWEKKKKLKTKKAVMKNKEKNIEKKI